jgi:hypothetical protein
MYPHIKEIKIPCSSPQCNIDESKIVSNLCSIWSIRWILNGYGYPQSMGMGKILYPWVWVWVEFFTHQLSTIRVWVWYCSTLPIHCPLPSLLFEIISLGSFSKIFKIIRLILFIVLSSPMYFSLYSLMHVKLLVHALINNRIMNFLGIRNLAKRPSHNGKYHGLVSCIWY